MFKGFWGKSIVEKYSKEQAEANAYSKMRLDAITGTGPRKKPKKKRFQFVWWWPYIFRSEEEDFEFVVGWNLGWGFHSVWIMGLFKWIFWIGPLEIRRWR